jgi:hypothetical protein
MPFKIRSSVNIVNYYWKNLLVKNYLIVFILFIWVIIKGNFSQTENESKCIKWTGWQILLGSLGILVYI